MQALSCGSHLGDSEADFPNPGVLLHGQLPKLGGPGSVLMQLRSVSCILVIFAGFWFCTIRKYIILSTRDCQGGLIWQRIQHCLHRFLSSSTQGTQEGEHK